MLSEVLTLLVPLSLLVLVAVPRGWANKNVGILRNAITSALVVQLLIATVGLAALVLGLSSGSGELAAASVTASPVAGVSVVQQLVDSLDHYDGVSALMFLLVSFLGVVVCRYSVRYLDGEPKQGAYFCWLGFTLGSVSMLVLAGNLVLLFVAWVMTSFGLHHLLLHYGDRPWARRAAWTKFAISRLGDVFLLTALLLVYREFGSYQLADILAAAKAITEPSWQLSLVGWFLILGAVTKSAQFPVHFWLPETMEAPTPVSALMHAGIVNAGGYLLVRLSPLVVHAPAAMITLTVIGGFTAVFAGVVMMTQSNVKRALGFSTIAQMGFMMLQCGLGAFSAAMLHIVAHSLYKAHAFLRTGDAWQVENIPSSQSMESGPSGQQLSSSWQQVELAVATLLTGIALMFGAGWFGFDFSAKAGGIVLGSILCLAIASWLIQARQASWRVVGTTTLAGLSLIGVYLFSYSLVHAITQAHLPEIQSGAILTAVGLAIVGLFTAIAILQTFLPQTTRRRWLQVLYVHASNGFYVDTIFRRALGLSLTHTPSSS